MSVLPHPLLVLRTLSLSYLCRGTPRNTHAYVSVSCREYPMRDTIGRTPGIVANCFPGRT